MRFWFGLGVDGFRIDVAHGLAKAEGLPDVGSIVWPPVDARDRRPSPLGPGRRPRHLPARGARWPTPTRIRACSSPRHGCTTPSGWRSTSAPTSCTRRSTSTSCWRRGTPSRCASRSSPRCRRTRRSAPRPRGFCPTTTRSERSSRYARPQGVRPLRKLSDLVDLPADFAVGRRRARAAALLMLALPGGAYVYQGEELGLAEVEDLPEEVLQDPGWEQSGRTERGRDGCRVPIPWSGEEPPFGFSPDDATRAAVAAPAGGLARADRRGADRRRALDARALPSRAAPPPRAAGARRRHASVAGSAGRRAGVRAGPGIRVHRQPVRPIRSPCPTGRSC